MIRHLGFFFDIGRSCQGRGFTSASSELKISKITLNWQDNSNNEGGFEIERKLGASSYEKIAEVGTNIETYVDLVFSGGDYCYRVRAYNESGHTPYTNEACIVWLKLAGREAKYKFR